jgi:hypothetical protein
MRLEEYRLAPNGTKTNLAADIVRALNESLPHRRFLYRDAGSGRSMDHTFKRAHRNVCGELNPPKK